MKRKSCFEIFIALTIAIAAAGVSRAQATIALSGDKHPSGGKEAESKYAQFIDQISGKAADDLVRYALEHNGELQAARAMIAGARGRLRQAGLKPNPTIETSGSK